MRPMAKPAEIFTPDEWESLRGVSNWKGLALVAHAWGVIALAMAASVIWPNPLVWLLAIMVVGCRQLGLAILMHEAAHGLLHPNRKINDWVGQWLGAAPIGADLHGYRTYHLSHHKNVQTDKDPDLGLSAPFPVSKASLRRKIIRDLTGQTFFKQRVGLFLALANKGERGAAGLPPGAGGAVAKFLIVNLIVLALCVLAGAPGAFLIWLIAMATWFPLATRIRNIAEHACVTSTDDPFTHARTTHANLLERAFIAPYWVNYHLEHHLFMYLPCYRLPAAHRLLEEKGLLKGREISPGYRDVLRRVVKAPVVA